MTNSMQSIWNLTFYFPILFSIFIHIKLGSSAPVLLLNVQVFAFLQSLMLNPDAQFTFHQYQWELMIIFRPLARFAHLETALVKSSPQ